MHTPHKPPNDMPVSWSNETITMRKMLFEDSNWTTHMSGLGCTVTVAGRDVNELVLDLTNENVTRGRRAIALVVRDGDSIINPFTFRDCTEKMFIDSFVNHDVLVADDVKPFVVLKLHRYDVEVMVVLEDVRFSPIVFMEYCSYMLRVFPDYVNRDKNTATVPYVNVSSDTSGIEEVTVNAYELVMRFECTSWWMYINKSVSAFDDAVCDRDHDFGCSDSESVYFDANETATPQVTE